MELFLGGWQGSWEERSAFWLRWWDENDRLLFWSSEQAALEHEQAEAEWQRAEVNGLLAV
jgi:hypothetical protein